MFRRGIFDQIIKAPIRRIGVKVKEINVKTMVTTINKFNMIEMEIKTATTTSSRVTMEIGIIGVSPMSQFRIKKLF